MKKRFWMCPLEQREAPAHGFGKRREYPDQNPKHEAFWLKLSQLTAILPTQKVLELHQLYKWQR